VSTTYRVAPEVEEVARKLIEEHHQDLVGVRVDFLFRSPPAASSGRLVLGKARKISGLSAFLAGHDGPFLVMEIAEEPWQDLSERKRAALVDHELCHMGVDENGAPAILGHDVEEFVVVVERHGIWTRALETLQLASQLALPFEGGPETEGGLA
jgi:predicted metallopeptidase